MGIIDDKIREHEESTLAHSQGLFWLAIIFIVFVSVLSIWIYDTFLVKPYIHRPTINDCELLKEKLNASSYYEYIGSCDICWQNCTNFNGKNACETTEENCKNYKIQ